MTSFPLYMQEYTQHVMDLLTVEFAPKPRSYQLSFTNSNLLIASTETPCLRVGLVGPGLCQEATAEFQKLFGLKFQIVAVWEVSEYYGLHADERARKCFPHLSILVAFASGRKKH